MNASALWRYAALMLFSAVLGLLTGQYSVKSDIAKLEAQTTRIEHYLSSRDPNYWTVVREMGEQ